jgi:hypothetical protein
MGINGSSIKAIKKQWFVKETNIEAHVITTHT